MPKTISVSEAKNKLSAVLDWTVDEQDEVIVESRGRPKAVIVSYDEYEKLLVLREAAERQAALQRLEAIAARIQEQNKDLDAERAEELADEISRETIGRMADEGKVDFQSS